MRTIFPFHFSFEKTTTIIPGVALAFCLTGTAQAQSQSQAGESATATATAKGSAGSNQGNPGSNKDKKAQKKSPRRNADGNPANYHGAQPPQGGRVGQGPSEESH